MNENAREEENNQLPGSLSTSENSIVPMPSQWATDNADGNPRVPVQRSANPDDVPVKRPAQGRRGVIQGPNYLGLAGRTAIVQAQIFLMAGILVVQLWLVTDALFSLLSGRSDILGWLALASAIGFGIALIVALSPKRSISPRSR